MIHKQNYLNNQMNVINELFNTHKTVDIEPYIHRGWPRVRGIPADRALSGNRQNRGGTGRSTKKTLVN